MKLEVGRTVQVRVEGKEHAIAVGILLMSTAAIKQINKGIAIQICHYLGDGLYQECIKV